MARHSDRLERIIVDLLSLSRLDSVGETTGLDLVEGRLHDVANAAVEQVRPRAEARAVRLELDCATELKGRINAPLLEQALVNLLDNAVTYSQPGQTVRLTVEADPTTDDVVLQVTDTGCGIPAE
ncbi:MAG TPA: PAS domain-containing sensor histidine kinase, partial [Armatimonadetes bacterium]|nr:PAS domain-containing sensor histidine kinase [Armatimonadota bacterium]